MMLRPVKFDASRDPRAGQPHHCGLNAHVSIDKFISIALLDGTVNFAAQFRQQFHFDILVGERNHVIGDVHGFIAQTVRVG